jgi:hypothetical protein
MGKGFVTVIMRIILFYSKLIRTYIYSYLLNAMILFLWNMDTVRDGAEFKNKCICPDGSHGLFFTCG